MCDCYGHKCGVCGREWPIHLMDFATNREEINVYCEKHFPFTKITSPNPFSKFKIKDEDYGNHTIIIEYLTENALDNKDGNHPNCDYEL